jgi:hypothetical protein
MKARMETQLGVIMEVGVEARAVAEISHGLEYNEREKA